MGSMKHPKGQGWYESFFVHGPQPERDTDWWLRVRYVSHMRFLSGFAWWCCWWVFIEKDTSVQDFFSHWDIQLFHTKFQLVEFRSERLAQKVGMPLEPPNPDQAFRVYWWHAPNLVPASHRRTSDPWWVSRWNTWNTATVRFSSVLWDNKRVMVVPYSLALWGFPRVPRHGLSGRSFLLRCCVFFFWGGRLNIVKVIAIQLTFCDIPQCYHNNVVTHQK